MAQITVFTDGGTADGLYEGLRRMIADGTVLTPVSGLGTAAYAYVDEDTGPVVVAYDGNLYIRLVWAPLEQQMLPVYGCIARALIEVGRQAMGYLRT